MRPSVSIVVPALNEEANIAGLLDNLLASAPDEIVLVDGGSTDRTVEIARKHSRVRILRSGAGRGAQMNHGAANALGDVFLFLHADVRLRPGTLQQVREAMADPAVAGGNLDIRYTGGDWVAALFSFVNRWRRHAGIFYGDSGIFCRRTAFEAMGGFRPWPIMEDYEFARRLWKRGGLAFLEAPIEVSDRRWRKAGLAATMLSWVVIQALYLLGAPPERLARLYKDIR